MSSTTKILEIIKKAASEIISSYRHHTCEEIAWVLENLTVLYLYNTRIYVSKDYVYSGDPSEKHDLYTHVLELFKYIKEHPKYEISALDFIIEKLIKECFSSNAETDFESRVYLIGLIENIKNTSFKFVERDLESKKYKILGVLNNIQLKINRIV